MASGDYKYARLEIEEDGGDDEVIYERPYSGRLKGSSLKCNWDTCYKRVDVSAVAVLSIVAAFLLVIVIAQLRDSETDFAEKEYYSVEEECSQFKLHNRQDYNSYLSVRRSSYLDYNVSVDILNNLKRVDPCENFYEFACGGWESTNPIPKYADEWSVFSALEKSTGNIVEELLQGSGDKTDITAFKQAQVMYTKCLEHEHGNNNSLNYLTPANEICTGVVRKKFEFALANKYVKREYSNACDLAEHLKEVKHMFRHIKDSFRLLRNSSSHLTYVLDNMTDICIGFPDWILDDKIVQKEYDGLDLNHGTFVEQTLAYENWQTKKKESKNGKPNSLDMHGCDWSQPSVEIGASSDDKLHKTYLSMDMLQRPLFILNLRNIAPNYGSLGTVIGHELVHALADVGWQHIHNGTLEPREQCLVNQYSNFSMTVSENEKLYLNGTKTLRENFADNAGLLLAHHAFKHAITMNTTERNNDTSQNKTLLDEFTDDQRFFLTYAQTWCQSYTMEGWRSVLINDEHSPGMFRVLGTLQNSEEFAQAWNCPVGTNMNPDPTKRKKCHLF